MRRWTRRRCLMAMTSVLGGLLGGSGSPLGRPPARPASRLPEATIWPGTARRPDFPVRARPGRRHLEDAAGAPFLLHADVPGNILVQLRRNDALHYLDDRARRGFNALFTGLIEKFYASRPPFNAYGDAPFHVRGDFGTPADPYFAHVDWFLAEARQRGFLVGLAPAWLGFNAGKEGWHREMVANGPDRLRDYGRYLGKRYGRLGNVLWIHAGDYNPPDKRLVRAIAEGIREFDRQSLHTALCAPGFAALDYWRGESWLSLDSVYTYGPVYPPALHQYRDTQGLPFILMESAFENEHGVDERGLRTQAYQALLTGATGHVFGNNPIWHFDGPGIYPAPTGWREALGSRGAQSMTHLRNLFAIVDWTGLVPDVDGRFLMAGHGEGKDRAVAAVAADRSFAMAYLPSARRIVLDFGRLTGPVAGRWFDPAVGTFHPLAEPAMDAAGFAAVPTPHAVNAAGHTDWVLLLSTAG